MNTYMEKLKADLAEECPESVLQMLYSVYQERYPTNSAEITEEFKQLNDVLSRLTVKECDKVWDLTCALCSEFEEKAFLEGVRVGVRLAEEM